MRSALSLLVIAFALAGCTPDSPYRHTALAPSSHVAAFDGRTAAEGTLRVEGSLYRKTLLRNDRPTMGDTALWTPAIEANGAASLALSDNLELGVRGAFAHGSWFTRSAEGTPPLASDRAYLAVGPELRATFFNRGGRGFALGLLLSAMASRVPTSSWERTADPCKDPVTCYTDPLVSGAGSGTYRLMRTGREDTLVTSGFLYPTYAFGEGYGHIVGALGVTSNFKNDGFSETPQGKPIEAAPMVPVAGLGYAIAWHGVRLMGMWYAPLSTSGEGVNYGSGAVVTIGGDIALWKKEPVHALDPMAPVDVRGIERRAADADDELERERR
jgi:hypothetical protein